MNDRQRVTLHLEGQMLQLVSSHGKDLAAEHVRGVIDGCFNALIRIEGVDETAKFSFALADRIVGGLKQPTAWPLPAVVEAVPAEPPPAVTVPPPAPAPTAPPFWPAFFIGFGLGVTVALGLARVLYGAVP